jgi:hypothetical protein
MAPFRVYLSNLRLNKQIYPSYYFEEYRDVLGDGENPRR